MGKHTQQITPNPDWRQVLPADGYTSPLPADTQAVLEMVEAHEQMKVTRVLDDAGVLNADDRQASLATVSGKMGKAIAMLTGGALAAGVLSAGLIAAGPGVSTAQAAEAPTVKVAATAAPAAVAPGGKTWTRLPGQSRPAMHDVEPDPVAGPTGVYSPVVPVTIAAQTVRVRIPVTTHTTSGGLHCGAVYGPSETGRAWVGGGCSVLASFPVTVTLDARFIPLGRSYVSIIDVYDPEGGYPQTVALQTRRQSRFQVATWADQQDGTLAVRVPLQHYSPTAGTWVPSQASPVQIQKRVGNRWVVVAKLTTNRYGIAITSPDHPIPLGAGVWPLRAVRPVGANVTDATGTKRWITITDRRRYDYS